jgi:CO dehydrogenase/acetyl-CoA synthase delta subunit
MMMHPDAVTYMKKVIQQLMTRGKAKPDKIANWATQRYRRK